MTNSPKKALEIEEEAGTKAYPEPYRAKLDGRRKRRLADAFGLGKFGVNLTELAPGAASSEFHWHSAQEEFVYVLEGWPTLRVGDTETELAPGDCVGFPADTGTGHRLVNDSDEIVRVLEIGDRAPGDTCHYPEAGFGPIQLYPDED